MTSQGRSSAFEHWGHRMANGRRLILVLAAVFAVFGAIWGTGAIGGMVGGAGFDDPRSESVEADTLLADGVGRHAPDAVVLYSSSAFDVDDPRFVAAVDGVVRRVGEQQPQGVAAVESYWTSGRSELVAKDRHSTYLVIRLHGRTEGERVDAFKAVSPELVAPGSDIETRFGGVTAMTEQVNRITSADIVRAEVISLPILVFLLIVVFGGLAAAALPMVVGTIVVLGALALLRVIEMFTEISTFAINIVTILGLGLSIDYTLFVVRRFRAEFVLGGDVRTVVARTVAAAGRTVGYSGIAVAVSFLGLVLFPSRFLITMGFAGAAVVLVAGVAALTVLPALLAVTGHRVAVPRRRRFRVRSLPSGGMWRTWREVVLGRPIAAVGTGVVLLGVLAAPLLAVNWARPAEWVLPNGADARSVTAALDTGYSSNPLKEMTVVIDREGDGVGSGGVDRYLEHAAKVPGVTSVANTATDGAVTRLSLSYSVDPMSREAAAMVRGVRAIPPPDGARVLVTGMPASRVDIVGMIGRGAPWMALFVAAASILIYWMAFRSFWLPVIAVLLNAAGILAALGVVVGVFQNGYLESVLGVAPMGLVDADFPVLIVAIAFGMAMDYEAFLLSLIKEGVTRGDGLDAAIAGGVRESTSVITSAALLLCVVVGGFAFSDIALMAMIGIGLIVAILIDVTVIRFILVPATTKLVGARTWAGSDSVTRAQP